MFSTFNLNNGTKKKHDANQFFDGGGGVKLDSKNCSWIHQCFPSFLTLDQSSPISSLNLIQRQDDDKTGLGKTGKNWQTKHLKINRQYFCVL